MRRRRRILDDHHAARAERLARETSLAREVAPSASSSEAKVAREIEAKYPKDKILELYLNQIYLGNGAYGVETASQRYFGKSVARPERRRGGDARRAPQGARRATIRAQTPNRSVQRRNTVLEPAARQRAPTPAETERVEGLSAAASSSSDSAARAEYFVEWVRSSSTRDSARSSTSGISDLHHARPRHPAGRRARAGGPARGDRERGRGKFEHPTYEQYQNSKAERGRQRDRRTTPYLQGRSSTSRPRPADPRDDRAVATSTTASSTARRRRCGSRDRRSSRSSTRPRSRRAYPLSYYGRRLAQPPAQARRAATGPRRTTTSSSRAR